MCGFCASAGEVATFVAAKGSSVVTRSSGRCINTLAQKSLSVKLPRMQMHDRINEFRSCVGSFGSRTSAQQRVRRGAKERPHHFVEGEFTRTSTLVGRDISDTRKKLGKLAQRAISEAAFCVLRI